MNRFARIVAALLVVATSPSWASCGTNQTTGESTCAARVKDLLVPTDGPDVLVRLHDTDPADLDCQLDGGYWHLPKSDPNHQAYYQLLLVSAATGNVVELSTAGPDSDTCDARRIRLISP
jgi:hypothetical protein